MIYGTDRAICENCDEILPRAAAGRCPICRTAVNRAKEPAIDCRYCDGVIARGGPQDCAFCQAVRLNQLVSDHGERIKS